MIPIIDRPTEHYRLAIENGYKQFVDHYFGGDHFTEQMVMNFLITVVLYWTVGLALLYVDYYDRPRFLLRYRIQPTSQVHEGKLSKLIWFNLLNNAVSIFAEYIYCILSPLYFTAQPRVPTLSRFLVEWIVFNVTREISFYYLHRLSHHPSIYRHIHKKHHEWQSPIAITALYANPVDHIISNVIPLALGPLLMNSHNLTLYIWLVYAILSTLNFHSGYHFPMFLSPLFHDFHHLKFTCNYGFIGFMDRFHGTDKSFRKSEYYDKDVVYFSLNPPKSSNLDDKTQ